jgi:hypothetical protein
VGVDRRRLSGGRGSAAEHRPYPQGRAYAAAWDNSPQFRAIHVRLSVVIGTLMIAYAILRIVIIFAASSVAEAVWAQEVPGLVLLVAVLALIRLNVPKLSRIVDAEQERPTAPEPAPAHG